MRSQIVVQPCQCISGAFSGCQVHNTVFAVGHLVAIHLLNVTATPFSNSLSTTAAFSLSIIFPSLCLSIPSILTSSFCFSLCVLCHHSSPTSPLTITSSCHPLFSHPIILSSIPLSPPHIHSSHHPSLSYIVTSIPPSSSLPLHPCLPLPPLF